MKRVIKCNTNNDKDFYIVNNTLFHYNGSEKHITIPDGVKDINFRAFEDCDSIETIKLPNSMSRIPGHAFSGCSSLASITIPDSVTSIGDGSFESCSSLTSIEIPNSVMEIGSWAFARCSSLTSIDIPEGITRIQKYTFFKCKDLETVSLPSTLESVEKGAFERCISLKRVDLPEGVTFGESVFDGTPLESKYQSGQHTYEDKDIENISDNSTKFDNYFDKVWQAYCDRIHENYSDVEIDGAKQGYDGVTTFYLDGDYDGESYQIDERASYELLKRCFEESVPIEDAIEELDELGM